MPVLPFHRYIGPGNKVDNGNPVDEDDRIARQHDINYENAKTEEDIRKADVQAIILFRKNWHDGNWHSLIGDVGLSVKYFVESFTGVIYPDVHFNEKSQRNKYKQNNFIRSVYSGYVFIDQDWNLITEKM